MRGERTNFGESFVGCLSPLPPLDIHPHSPSLQPVLRPQGGAPALSVYSNIIFRFFGIFLVGFYKGFSGVPSGFLRFIFGFFWSFFFGVFFLDFCTVT